MVNTSWVKRLPFVQTAVHSRFLLRSIFETFVLPVLIAHGFTRLAAKGIALSTSVTALVYILAIPLNELISSLLSSRRKSENRNRLGARSVPKVKGKWPGNIDILRALIKTEEEEYPGDLFLRWANEYGPTYDMGILWASQVCTLRNQKSIHAHWVFTDCYQ